MTVRTVAAVGVSGDYTCDGVDDDLTIQAAIGASSAGDTVQLSTGTFACAASLALTAGVDLVGSAGTVLAYAGTVARRLALLGDNTLSTLSITGPLTVEVRASDCTVADVYSAQSQATVNAPDLLFGRAAFRVTSRTVVDGALAPVERVTFERCTAHETYGTGFYLDGDPEGIDPVDIPSRYSDITFRDCLAEGCGTGASRYNNYVVGFNLGESSYATMVVEDVKVVDCVATGNWESGYHAEFAPSYAGCTITGCTATGNGVNPTPTYAAGFLVAPGWAVTDCTADGNARAGFRVGTHPNNGHVGDPVSLTRCTAIGPASPANYCGFFLHGHTVGLELGGALLDTCTCQDNGPLATAHLRDVRDVCIRDFAEINSPASVLAYANCTYYLAPFSTTPAAPVAGEAVAFADLSDNDGLTAWSWDFGDGSGSADQHPTHTFAAPGRYVVTLAAGGNTVSREVVVAPDPREHVCRDLRKKRARQARWR